MSRRNTSTQSSDKPESVEGTVVRRKKPILSHVLRTLDPSRLLPEDFLDLSERTSPYIRYNYHKNDRFGGLAHAPQIFYHWEGQHPYGHIAFPPGTRGFLYFKAIPGVPLLACGIRFRITGHWNPASFEGGRDLLLPNGYPWSILAIRTVTMLKYGGFREVLIRDGLIPRNVLENATAMLGSGRVNSQSSIIYSLDQEFITDIQFASVRFWIMRGNSHLARGMLQHIFVTRQPDGKYIRPYRDDIYHRFCLSPLRTIVASRTPEHTDSRSSIVKIIDPVEQVSPNVESDLLKPKEGGLVMRISRSKASDRHIRVYSF